MHTDELRAELTELADEVDPFTGDVRAVRRRVARKRITTALAATAVAAVVAIGVIALVHSRSSQVHVAHSVKDVELTQLRSFDAAVVLAPDATAADAERVTARLDETPAVAQYAILPAGTLAFDLKFNRTPAATALRTRVCADPSTQSFAITLARGTPDALSRLTAAIGTDATVQPIEQDVADLEVFMNVNATAGEVAAVRAQITADPDITKDTFIDHQAAYEDFKKLFADQPELVQNETPTGLPESFRLEVRDGVPLQTVADRLQGLAGVGRPVQVRSTHYWLVPQTRPAGAVEVFMQVKATDVQTRAIAEQLKRDPRVASYKFISHEDAYVEFRTLFSDQPSIIENETPAGLPTSYSVELSKPSDKAAFEQDYQALPGVKTVTISDGGFAEVCSAKP